MTQRVRTAGRFLLLGAFLNVICCWFLVGVVSFPPKNAVFLQGTDLQEPWTVATWRPRGGMMVSAALNQTDHDCGASSLAAHHLPGWSRLQAVPAYTAGEEMPKLYDIAYGWPLLSLSLSYDSYHSPFYGALLREEVSGAVPGVEFPARVIPMGFAFNTGFFALASWGLALVLLKVRSRARRRHGCCPDCAHDLLGALGQGCPRCGWTAAPVDVAENA